MNHRARRCTARRIDGRPCRAWAVRDSDPALCVSHLKAARQRRPTEAGGLGFYEAAYTVEEAASLVDKTGAGNLNDELNVARLAVRHALLQLKQDLYPAEYARIIALIFKGTRAIAAILRIQRALFPGQYELLPPEISDALDETSAETGCDL